MKRSTEDNGNDGDAWPENTSRLEELRRAIDVLDAGLLAALNRRTLLSLEVGKLKAGLGAPVFCPEREATLLDRLTAQNNGPLPNEHLLAIYREILSSSRAMQKTQSGTEQSGGHLHAVS